MLIDLTIANHRSFKEETVFSMVSSREQRFQERLPHLKSKYRMRVTPVAGIYGANAGGKTNLVKALGSLRNVILNSNPNSKTIEYFPFKLDPKSAREPTMFRLRFFWKDSIYEYEIKYDRRKIYSESLIKYRSADAVEVFSRTPEETEFGDLNEGSPMQTLVSKISPTMPVVSALAAFEGESELSDIIAPYSWIKRLFVIGAGFLNRGTFPLFSEKDLDFMRAIGAGIDGLDIQESSFEDLRIPEDLQADYLENMEPGEGRSFEFENSHVVLLMQEDGEVKVLVARFSHQAGDKQIALDWNEESDGTKAAAKLYPLLKILSTGPLPTVVIIDEIDRSFHSTLTLNFIQAFLASCSSDSRSQLIFTTHDLMLMDTDVFRRDEMWIVEKDKSGASELISLSEYRGLRHDKDLRKSYLQGRFGGVPNIGNLCFPSHDRLEEGNDG